VTVAKFDDRSVHELFMSVEIKHSWLAEKWGRDSGASANPRGAQTEPADPGGEDRAGYITNRSSYLP
jgi:hypothetical protein